MEGEDGDDTGEPAEAFVLDDGPFIGVVRD